MISQPKVQITAVKKNALQKRNVGKQACATKAGARHATMKQHLAKALTTAKTMARAALPTVTTRITTTALTLMSTVLGTSVKKESVRLQLHVPRLTSAIQMECAANAVILILARVTSCARMEFVLTLNAMSTIKTLARALTDIALTTSVRLRTAHPMTATKSQLLFGLMIKFKLISKEPAV